MLKLGLMGRSLAFLSPLMIGSMLTSAPVEAATLSSARSNLTIRFNTAPTLVLTLTEAETNTNSVQGQVQANADSEASGVNQLFENSASVNANGTGEIYDGDAFGLAGVAGLFSVNAETPFSLRFDAAFNLDTQIDNPLLEAAESVGLLGFLVIDVTNSDLSDPTTFEALLGSLRTFPEIDLPILAAFRLNGQLSTTNPDFLNFSFSGVSVDSSTVRLNTGLNQESGAATFTGSFSQQFTSSRTLAVVDAKLTQSNVRAVPAPSMLLGTLVSGGMMLWRRRSSQTMDQTSGNP